MRKGKYRTYTDEIKELAVDKSEKIFFNGPKETTDITIKAIYDTTNDYIYFICQSLTSPEFMPIQIKKFLSENDSRNVYILFEQITQEQTSVIKELMSEFPDRLVVKKLTGHCLYDGQYVNWLVADDRIFRFVLAPGEDKAWGSFNDPGKATQLKDGFLRFFNGGHAIDLFKEVNKDYLVGHTVVTTTTGAWNSVIMTTSAPINNSKNFGVGHTVVTTTTGDIPNYKYNGNFDRIEYERDLAERQRKHLESIRKDNDPNWSPCLHDACPLCHGTGVKYDGSACIHFISCPCPKCTPR